MSGFEIIKHTDFVQVKNVLNNKEIEYLLKRWEDIENGKTNYKNKWDVNDKTKTKIITKVREVEIYGIQKDKIFFLTDKIKKVFSLFFDYEYGIEGPHFFTKYSEGSFHSWHYDTGGSFGVTREKIITLQLSDGDSYVGGDLIINGIVAPREKGSAIIYDGDVLHEVTKVTKGTRFSITDCDGKFM